MTLVIGVFLGYLLFAPIAFASISDALASAADDEERVVTYRVPLSNNAKLALGYPEESVLNFTGIAGNNGYETEEHTITTEDGYILKMFRIGSKLCNSSKGTPVLVMHGFVESADLFLDAGPGAGMAYLLADSCYDTWIGNARGNTYGRAHTTLNPDKDAAFWKFSVDELGMYDVPAHIDYVLNNTGYDKLNYVGFSQGAGSILITNSERPEYNNKVNVAVFISPASRVLNTKSSRVRLVADEILKLKNVLSIIGIGEVLFKGSVFQTFFEFLCHMADMLGLQYELCKDSVYILDSYHPDDAITPKTQQILFSHFPAGTSLQLLTRYAQSLHIPDYQKYDFGSAKENMVHYGSETPPIYDLSKVVVPVVITYGANDYLVDPLDIMWLKNRLPNVLEVKLVDNPYWTHLDNAYNSMIPTLLYPTVDKYLAQYTSINTKI